MHNLTTQPPLSQDLPCMCSAKVLKVCPPISIGIHTLSIKGLCHVMTMGSATALRKLSKSNGADEGSPGCCDKPGEINSGPSIIALLPTVHQVLDLSPTAKVVIALGLGSRAEHQAMTWASGSKRKACFLERLPGDSASQPVKSTTMLPNNCTRVKLVTPQRARLHGRGAPENPTCLRRK